MMMGMDIIQMSMTSILPESNISVLVMCLIDWNLML